MKFYKDDLLGRNKYLYIVEKGKRVDKCCFKEHNTERGAVSSDLEAVKDFFKIGSRYLELTEQQFNDILLNAGMKEHMVATSLKSKIIRAF